MHNNPIKVGITGGIGAGKSVVSKLFQILGRPVYDADRQAKWLMNNSPELIEKIKETFGSQSYADGRLNRDYIAGQVFNNQERLAQINSLVHPAVGRDFNNWVISHNHQPYVLKEAALLIESGSYKGLEYMINVCSPVQSRKERVLIRDGFRSETELDRILENQLGDTERSAIAKWIIRNDEEHSLIEQVVMIDQELAAFNDS